MSKKNLLWATIACLAFWPFSASGQLVYTPDIWGLQQQLKQCRTDTARIPILLNIANNYAVKPGELASDLDSAQYCADLALKLNTNANPKFEGLYWLVCAKLNQAKRNIPLAEICGKKAAGILEKSNQYECAGDANLAMSYFYSINLDSVRRRTAIGLCERAVAFYNLAHDVQKKAELYGRLAELYEFNKERQRARDTLAVVLEMNKTTPIENMNEIYLVLRMIESDAGNYDMAVKYMLLSIKMDEQMWGTTSSRLIEIYNQAGLLFYNIDEFEQAEIYYKKAFDLSSRNKYFNFIRPIINNVVHVQLVRKEYEDALKFVSLIDRQKNYPFDNLNDKNQAIILRCLIYASMHDYKAIGPYIEQLQFISDTDPIDSYRGLNPILIKYFLFVKDIPKAQKYFDAIKLHSRTIDEIKYDLKFQFVIDTTAHKYRDALPFYIRYSEINDSLLDLKAKGKIAQLQIEYQTEEKNQQLVLSRKNIELLSREDQINKVIRNVVIAGAIALIILLSLLYSRYRMRTRTNLALQAQQAEITRKNAALETLVSEKEWLLKEVHHRVKNNLQVVISLLRMQTSYLDDTQAIRAIRESRHRLQAIALLHQKLYQSDQVEVVDMDSYVKDLISYLKDSFGLSNVRFDLHVESLKLPVSNAVPMGLVINEAVTNAVKYGFPDKRSGLVKIILHLTSSGTLSLSISDNGIGMDVEQLETGLKSMGIRLIQMLAGQMNGHLEITSGNGVTVSITDIPFADDPFAVLPRT